MVEWRCWIWHVSLTVSHLFSKVYYHFYVHIQWRIPLSSSTSLEKVVYHPFVITIYKNIINMYDCKVHSQLLRSGSTLSCSWKRNQLCRRASLCVFSALGWSTRMFSFLLTWHYWHENYIITGKSMCVLCAMFSIQRKYQSKKSFSEKFLGIFFMLFYPRQTNFFDWRKVTCSSQTYCVSLPLTNLPS